MASPGELVQTLADALSIPAATVTLHDRNLVSAGLRSKGGRGRSAAQVTPRDAAHLLTAILGSSQVKDSVATIKRYAATRPESAPTNTHPYARTSIAALAGLPAQHSFIDALEALLGAAAHDDGEAAAIPIIEIAALSPGTLGDIRLAGLKSGRTCAVRYRAAAKTQRPQRAPALPDLEQYRRVSAHTIARLAHCLAK